MASNQNELYFARKGEILFVLMTEMHGQDAISTMNLCKKGLLFFGGEGALHTLGQK